MIQRNAVSAGIPQGCGETAQHEYAELKALLFALIGAGYLWNIDAVASDCGVNHPEPGIDIGCQNGTESIVITTNVGHVRSYKLFQNTEHGWQSAGIYPVDPNPNKYCSVQNPCLLEIKPVFGSGQYRVRGYDTAQAYPGSHATPYSDSETWGDGAICN